MAAEMNQGDEIEKSIHSGFSISRPSKGSGGLVHPPLSFWCRSAFKILPVLVVLLQYVLYHIFNDFLSLLV